MKVQEISDKKPNIRKMKTKLRASALVFFLLLGILWMPAKSAVVSTLTASEFVSLVSTYEAAFSAYYRGGVSETGSGDEEMRLARNISQPTPGGDANTLVGQVVWVASGNTLGVSIDEQANVSARANAAFAGSPPDYSLPLIRTFNQVLIFVWDASNEGANDLQNITINGTAVRNMFADGTGGSPQYDIVSITNFGSGLFDLNAVWGPGPTPNFDDQYVQIVALNNLSIPEPSSILLMGLSSVILLRRRR